MWPLSHRFYGGWKEMWFGMGALTSLLELPVANLLGVKPMPGVVQGAFCVVLNLALLCLCAMQTLAFVKSLFR